MIDTMDIYRALKETLTENFTAIPVQTKDIKNPAPPCFYIQLAADSSTQTASYFETSGYSYAVIYFSGEETILDLLTIKEQLKTLFQKPLVVTAYDDADCVNYVEISSFTSTIDEDDYILNCMLEIEHTQTLTAERYEAENDNTIDDISLDIDNYE